MDAAGDAGIAGVVDFDRITDDATGVSAFGAAHAALHALDHLGGELACRGAGEDDFGPLLVSDVRRLVTMAAAARARALGMPDPEAEAFRIACARSERFAYLTGLAMAGAREGRRCMVLDPG